MSNELLRRLRAGEVSQEVDLESDLTKAWGGYVTMVRNEVCTPKILVITDELSVQSHSNREELWYLVSGKLAVYRGPVSEDPVKTIAGLDEKILMPGDLVKIPKNTAHTALNLYPQPSLIMEVALGHAEEEDIRRYYDMHGRVSLEGFTEGISIRDLITQCRKYLKSS
ncbi:hypothetical protein GF386_01320 [Candidatus Pacearchaeota archaeon]|nr:hypothetical protein [Candidatus Pacearchaeota archaeon]